MPSALGGVFGIKTEVEQRVVMRAGHHGDVAAASAITAARSSTGHIFLAPERQAAIAPIPGFYADSDFIDEHGGGRRVDARQRETRNENYSSCMLMNLPLRPRSRKTTMPDRKSTRLNSSHLGISYAV